MFQDGYLQVIFNRDHRSPLHLNIRWNTHEVGNIKRLYIEMNNTVSPCTFHAFVDCGKREHNIATQLKYEDSKYRLTVYGLKQVERKQKQCYVICASCHYDMSNVDKSSKFSLTYFYRCITIHNCMKSRIFIQMFSKLQIKH